MFEYMVNSYLMILWILAAVSLMLIGGIGIANWKGSHEQHNPRRMLYQRHVPSTFYVFNDAGCSIGVATITLGDRKWYAILWLHDGDVIERTGPSSDITTAKDVVDDLCSELEASVTLTTFWGLQQTG